MKEEMKERKESRMTPSFLGLDDGVMVLPSLKLKKLEEEMIWSKGKTFGFGPRESEVMMEHPSRDGLQVA